MRDFIVVGGGIAGLAAAELLQRSGAGVLLVERHDQLCGEASGDQHGWFHTGALYAALPDRRFFRTMVGNLDDLRDYYAGFPRMNLDIGRHIFATAQNGWFSNRTNFYLYRHWKKVGWTQKLPWSFCLRLAKRRMSWFEDLDPKTLSGQVSRRTRPTNYVVHETNLGLECGDIAFTLRSRDRVMNTSTIGEDLLASFLAHGGELALGTRVEEVGRCEIVARSADGTQRFQGRHVILATGRGAIGEDDTVTAVGSPLMVVVPALADISFVQMSPVIKDTISHIYHRRKDFSYSVIGNASYFSPDRCDEALQSKLQQGLFTKVRRVTGEAGLARAQVYFGYKTEVHRAGSARNYLYHIIDRDRYVVALPGKFSLCFSLAVNLCRHFGIDPVKEPGPFEVDGAGRLIRKARHLRIARSLRDSTDGGADRIRSDEGPEVRAVPVEAR